MIRLPDPKVEVYCHLLSAFAKIDLLLTDDEIEELAQSMEVADGPEHAHKMKALAAVIRLYKGAA